MPRKEEKSDRYYVKQPDENHWSVMLGDAEIAKWGFKETAWMDACARNEDMDGVLYWDAISEQKRKLRQAIARIEYERGYGDGSYRIC